MTLAITSGVLMIVLAIICAVIPRRWANIVAGLSVIIPFILVTLSLGNPVQQWMMKGQEYEVIAFTYEEGKAIYLWARPDGGSRPVYIELPWSEPNASELEEGRAEAEANGQRPRIRLEGTPGGTLEVLPAPVQAPPPKIDG